MSTNKEKTFDFLEELLNSQDSEQWIKSIEDITDCYIIYILQLEDQLTEEYKNQVINQLFDLNLLRRTFTKMWKIELVKELKEIPIELLNNKHTINNLLRKKIVKIKSRYYGLSQGFSNGLTLLNYNYLNYNLYAN